MTTPTSPREQAAAGLEQLASLIRAQSWRPDGTPSLPPTQAAVMRMLVGSSEGMKARQIAERLGISAASLSDSLKAMESKGWIRREADPADKRASLVRLAPAGESIARQLREPGQGIASLVQPMHERDVGALLRVTQLLVLEAQRQGLATGARTCLGCRFFRPNSTGDARHPHFCEFISQPFGDPELRTDCAEQSPADAHRLAANAEGFRLHAPP
ncbi:MarR family winged helix-turn-helix transcriptional regulator [Lysobacter niastensis]|uniref:MarR family transcriptional regulator n=1 Tax=Lysobacter niastensis TaxID=380629 RepID=A0ABS0BCN4_9GAMM|nr:MarR family transcriptional regulator [Lysobacter niastensis]MBF6026028.1 MarR family transcriptional regulator [Lysobacter niastensis]